MQCIPCFLCIILACHQLRLKQHHDATSSNPMLLPQRATMPHLHDTFPSSNQNAGSVNEALLLKSSRKESLAANYELQSYFKTIDSSSSNHKNYLKSNATKSNTSSTTNLNKRTSLSSNACRLVCECSPNHAEPSGGHKVVKFKENQDSLLCNESASRCGSSARRCCSSCNQLNNSLDSQQTAPPVKSLKKQQQQQQQRGAKKSSALPANFPSSFLLELDRTLEKQFRPLVFSVTNTIERNERRQCDKVTIDKIKGEWQDLALVCDHFLCYFFPLMTLVVCMLIFVNSPHAFSQWWLRVCVCVCVCILYFCIFVLCLVWCC